MRDAASSEAITRTSRDENRCFMVVVKSEVGDEEGKGDCLGLDRGYSV